MICFAHLFGNHCAFLLPLPLQLCWFQTTVIKICFDLLLLNKWYRNPPHKPTMDCLSTVSPSFSLIFWSYIVLPCMFSQPCPLRTECTRKVIKLSCQWKVAKPSVNAISMLNKGTWAAGTMLGNLSDHSASWHGQVGPLRFTRWNTEYQKAAVLNFVLL